MNKDYPEIELDRMTLSSTSLNETLTMTAPMEDLSEVLEVMERFLRASGYLIQGRLMLVEIKDEYEDPQPSSMAFMGDWAAPMNDEEKRKEEESKTAAARDFLEKYQHKDSK